MDYYADSSITEIGITIKNDLGYDVTGVFMTASGCTIPSSILSNLRNLHQFSFAADGCSITGGQKYFGNINISFTNADTLISHKSQGSLITKVS